MVGGTVRRRRRTNVRAILIHAAGWGIALAVLGWLLLAGVYGLVNT
jgi:hypothetical protein